LRVWSASRWRGAQLLRLLLCLAANLLGALLRLGENRAGALTDALELAADRVGTRLVAAAGLEPVSEPVQELLDLALVVAPPFCREGRLANPFK